MQGGHYETLFKLIVQISPGKVIVQTISNTKAKDFKSIMFVI